LRVVACKKAISLLETWIKPMTYLKGKSGGDNSMSLKPYEEKAGSFQEVLARLNLMHG